MKLLIADKLPKECETQLQSLGITVESEPGLSADALPDRVGDADILIVRSTKVTEATIQAASRLQLIIRAGAGYNNIAVDAANRLGVFVANTPGKNAIAVAELTMGLMVALDRRIPQANAELMGGKWNKKEYGKSDGLFGKTLGIVGTGMIGRAVIERAQPFGLNIVAWSRSLTDARAEKLGVEHAPSLEALITKSDIVSLHIALTPETKGVIGAELLKKFKPNAMLINTARGAVVDEAAVKAAVDEGKLRYAADLFDGQPGKSESDFENALSQHEKTVCTPHIGASTNQSQNAVATEAVRIVERYVRAGEVPNAVNLCVQSPAQWQLNVRHYDRVGVLASVLDHIRKAELNVEELENVIFEGAQAACARIRLGGELPAAVVQSLNGMEDVIDATQVQL